ncbi:MAG: alanine:cation symporter family protein [Prevotella ruminicola]|jgi:AGCS family alanine or glycine:cation symporter|uniref:Alanine:cation symporter family protein n=1 Tax=Xylanibacter ruminicola TaxID=839 RepID=A0A928BUG6_XYLRU|nr:alanine:cation symporter family protein [Xylanibacter ruminicola]
MNELITAVNDVIWSYILIVALVGCGLWFTWRTKFVQFRMVGEMLRLLTESAVDSVGDQVKGKEKRHISSFQAFAVSVATRVGTGNLAGVATAIVIGGPGAVFWMWLIALIGSATAFVESTLAQLYKQKHKDSFIGGPAYYIQKGLKCRWMAVLFAILITLQFGLSNNSIQANTICGAMQEAFGWSPIWVGVALAAMALFIVFGGIQRIAKVSSVIVPLMAVGYIILALVIIIMNIHLIPHVFKVIILDAFGFSQIAGGSIGAAMMNGIKRGLFSNEAGEGSAPNAAATASTTHPVKQGLIQALGVFTDTLMVCSCTAFIILISGLYQVPELNGIALTQSALQSEIGSIGPMFIAVAIFLFAFSSIIGNYYYGEANIRFITQNNKVMTAYRIASAGLMVMFGALASFELVWNIVDLFMALLTACNLVAIVLLGRYTFRLLDDYRQQKRQGIKEPVFHRSKLPEIEDELECWE